MPRLAVEKWEQEHRKHVAESLKKIDRLFEETTKEMVRLGTSYSYDAKKGTPFSFADSKSKNKTAEQKIAEMRKKLEIIIFAGMTAAWELANEKNDSWVRQLFDKPNAAYLLHNLNALKAFRGRKIYGHTLSERVWDYSEQFEELIELALSVGLTEGRSAAQISRDIRAYLNNPDKLFRRVRDQYGNLVLSKAAKAYHPGQGVYRSSYQNAMRLARTEINSAYRESDYRRWQRLNFIVGYEVKTSNSHTQWLEDEWIPRFAEGEAPEEICDALEGKYPKDFKFIGWHPNCKCYAVPIIANEDNDRDFWEKPLNEVKDVPPKFKQWLEDNADRLERANKRGTLPYWVKENPKYTGITVGPLNTPEKSKIIAASRKSFEAYGPEWEKAYFDERSGGFVVIDKQRAAKGNTNKQEFAKFSKEVEIAEVYAQNGHKIEMLEEDSRKSSCDARIDGILADFKRTSSHNNIISYAKEAVRKQGAEIVLFQFDAMTPKIRIELNKLKSLGIRFKYFITGKNAVYSE